MSKRKRNILLVEPGYHTKFPPMGLMKLSTHHKLIGDNVKFVKGIKKSENYSVYYDRIYISTLFTYNWNITVKTINYYKGLVDEESDRLIVGGIMASLMPDDLEFETGIKPKAGLLDESDPFGDGQKDPIDTLIPDYDLFKNVKQQLLFEEEPKNQKEKEKTQKPEHPYTLIDDSYFGYTTRGCINRCDFCGVPNLEPKYIKYIDIKPYVNLIEKKYGSKPHLVLFDNNILASGKLAKIVNDLKDLGFEKDSTIEVLNKAKQPYKKKRYIDFNQGVDARIMVERKDRVKLIKDLAIKPLRIAFDHISEKEIYEKAVKLAADAEIQNLSNYILYNWDDTPEDLWERLKINIDLNENLGLKIYSFPMKYIPLNAKDRSFISEKWNWYYIRGVQRILNVLKGSVMTSREFFYRAFGKNKKEFVDILHMPEAVLMNRSKTPLSLETGWRNKFKKLNKGERNELLDILCEKTAPYQVKDAISKTKNKKQKEILDYYIMPENEVKNTVIAERTALNNTENS